MVTKKYHTSLTRYESSLSALIKKILNLENYLSPVTLSPHLYLTFVCQLPENFQSLKIKKAAQTNLSYTYTVLRTIITFLSHLA